VEENRFVEIGAFSDPTRSYKDYSAITGVEYNYIVIARNDGDEYGKSNEVTGYIPK